LINILMSSLQRESTGTNNWNSNKL